VGGRRQERPLTSNRQGAVGKGLIFLAGSATGGQWTANGVTFDAVRCTPFPTPCLTT
jgi:hypothetical protein